MTDFSDGFRIATSGMQAQSARLRYLSENIANADTPGYHRKTVTFAEEMGANGAVSAGRMQLDRSPLAQVYDPSHPLADADGYYAGTNVNLLVEIADSREAGRSYDANLKIFDQLRQMSSALLDLLRR